MAALSQFFTVSARLAAAGLLLLSFSGLALSQDRRVALVIGNAAYRDAPLKNPVNDARAMAGALRGAGFEVLLHENVGKAKFAEAVGTFGEKLSEGATGLFYFAGHGLQVQGRNYLVPVDAAITSEQRVRLETMDVEAVLDQMQAARTRVSMVILDACRNNPFERRFRSVGGGLAQISAPTGTLIAYATAPGKVAADGEGANGVYTQELLRALGQPGLKVEDVFKTVRVNVMRQTGEAQVPWESSSLTGDFVFVPGASAAPAAAAPAGDPAAVELAYWQSIAGSQNRADFEAYLARYPNGAFSELARNRLSATTAALAPQQRAPVAAQPTRLSADELRREIFGATFGGRSALTDRPLLVEIDPNGTVRMEAGRAEGIINSNDFERSWTSAPKYDQGTYRIVGDSICAKWRKMRNGSELCFDVVRKGNGEYVFVNPDGSPQTFTRKLR